MKHTPSATVRALALGTALALAASTAGLAQEADVFPEIVHQTSTPIANVPGDFELVTLVLAFDPGAWTPLHMHGGDGLVTVLEGAMTLEMLGEDPRPYATGEQWKEHVGRPHRAGNEGAERAVISVTFVLPRGTPTTIALE